MAHTFTQTDTFQTGPRWTFERISTKVVPFRPTISPGESPEVTVNVEYVLIAVVTEAQLREEMDGKLFSGHLTNGLIGSRNPVRLHGQPERLRSPGADEERFICRFRVLNPLRIGEFGPIWLDEPAKPVPGRCVDLTTVPR